MFNNISTLYNLFHRLHSIPLPSPWRGAGGEAVLSLLRGVGGEAVLLVVFTACSTEDPRTFEPQLAVSAATDISRTEATLHGTVALRGETQMPQLCFRYGTTTAMEQTIAVQTPETDNMATATALSQTISALSPGTTYYYALHATNGQATVESQPASFTTLPNVLATIGAPSILSYGPMSAIVGCEVLDNGGEPISKAGCYVSETENADLATCTVYEVEDIANLTTAIRTRIGSLQQDKTYYIRPFVETKIGQTVGKAISFTTTSAVLLEEAGQLASLVGDELVGYTQLKIAGNINGSDLATLRRMTGRNNDGTVTNGTLSDIDLTDALIIEGGASYDGQRFSEANVIGQGLFADCTNLRRIVLPSTAISIEKDAFSGCTGLQEIVIPASVSSIVPSTGCDNLEAITVSGGNIHYQSLDGVLLNQDATAILWFPMGKTGNYTLPATIAEIGDYAFQEVKITHFTLPDNITEIGQAVFYNSQVEEVTMPTNLTTIPTATFQKCSKLKTVTLGAKTNLISDYAFDGCPIETLTVLATRPPVCNKNAFTNTLYPAWTTTCTLYVHQGSKDYYRLHTSWKVFSPASHIKEK